jgi:pimeloyl-ACP methyl ester carboxylesterase
MASNLRYETIGEGVPLVLLHSLIADSTSFRPLAQRLAGERRSILVDLPGFRGSPPAKPDLGGYAESVAALFEGLGLPNGADVIGNGLGGFVGLVLASRHGERFRRLVLIGSTFAFPEAGRSNFRAMAEKVEADGMDALADAAMKRMLPDDFRAAHPAVVQEREAAFRQIDPKVFAATCRLLAGMDIGPDLEHVENPVFILAGSLDQATPPALGRALAARLADCEMMEMPGLGHAPHVQDPDAVIELIAPFLELRSAPRP